MNAEDKRKIILNHYQNPLNKLEEIKDEYIVLNSNNESCIDDITLYLIIEGNILKEIKFDGEACAVSIASTSIMTELILNKTIDEIKEIIINFEKMIDGNEYKKDLLKNALVFDDMVNKKARKLCTLLPYIALKKEIFK